MDDYFEPDFPLGMEKKLTLAEQAALQKEQLVKLMMSKFLSISSIPMERQEDLIDGSDEYAQWLRVVLLRTLLNTSALNSIKSCYTFATTKLYGFLGFQNFEEYSKNRDLAKLRSDLLLILSNWESDVGEQCFFPGHLKNNLTRLALMASLNSNEEKVLGLTILLHSESLLQECTEMLGESVSAFSVAKIYAPMLGMKTVDIEATLDEQSNLIRSGLLSLDHRGEGNVRSRVDLITWTFAKHAVMEQHDVRSLVKEYVRPAGMSELKMGDFGHIQERTEAVKAYLRKAIDAGQSGVNLLIYGKPGTGKSQFAKLICQELNCELMEVAATTQSGNPVTPMRRIRSYRAAQSLFQGEPSMILFDECEEVLSGQSIQISEDDVTMAQKSWINLTLETNPLPAIWVANSISGFDRAYIRRFDLCFEMPIPDEMQRREMLTQMCGDVIDEHLIIEIAKNKHSSPALVAKTAQVVNALAPEKTIGERNDLALMLVNDKLLAQGASQLRSIDHGALGFGFKPEMVNANINLDSLLSGIAKTREARICAWGPPGTGKTAFGKWMADKLAMQHIVLKASDLLGSRVGETEQKIARAFSTAKRQKALLQFDEVDSFLISRSKAKQSWEISMVNEMLTQMEAFKGIFIASTNLFDSLDEAALRRFDINMKFDFMSPDKAWEMFLATCEKLTLEVDEVVLHERFNQIRSLTPGDFEQVGRQSRFIHPESAAAVMHILTQAVAVKKGAPSRSIGFLAG